MRPSADPGRHAARWLPVALSVEDGMVTIEWGELGETEFTEPFFDQTIRRWAGCNPPPGRRRTGLDALLAHGTGPAPALVVFHLSRCGSTLLSRMLAAIPDIQSLSEPEPLNSFLLDTRGLLDPAMRVRALRALVSALGRPCRSRPQRTVLKTSSWNIRYQRLFRAAFPDTPMIWLHRTPADVLASLLRTPSGWMGIQHVPDLPEALFGLSGEAARGLTREEFCARALGSLFAAALQADGGLMPVLDHSGLPDAVWSTLAPLLGLDLPGCVIAHLRAVAGDDAKALLPRPYRPIASAAAPAGQQSPTGSLDPLYLQLEARRLMPPRRGQGVPPPVP